MVQDRRDARTCRAPREECPGFALCRRYDHPPHAARQTMRATYEGTGP